MLIVSWQPVGNHLVPTIEPPVRPGDYVYIDRRADDLRPLDAVPVVTKVIAAYTDLTIDVRWRCRTCYHLLFMCTLN